MKKYVIVVLFGLGFLISSCLETTGGAGVKGRSGKGASSATADPGAGAHIRCNNPNETNPYVCLMCNCFHEARGESPEGRDWVGRVVVTRKGMPDYPNSICGVVWDPSQFSWTKNPAARNLVLSPDGSTANKNFSKTDVTDGYARCRATTMQTMKLEQRHYASHYYKFRGPGRANPDWKSRCSGVSTHGDHKFFSQCYAYPKAPDLGVPTSETAIVSNDEPVDWSQYVCSL